MSDHEQDREEWQENGFDYDDPLISRETLDAFSQPEPYDYDSLLALQAPMAPSSSIRTSQAIGNVPGSPRLRFNDTRNNPQPTSASFPSGNRPTITVTPAMPSNLQPSASSTSNNASSSTASQGYTIIQVWPASDGIGSAATHPRSTRNDLYFEQRLARAWMAEQGIPLRPNVKYKLDRLPSGYSGWLLVSNTGKNQWREWASMMCKVVSDIVDGLTGV
ncbi:uncharacterized protein RHO25_009244 [Cercospora beticola]|uniref:Uncharacterized protein n=1 Tax=Cercospora beticola TaxID=122368 RepID=A0ABZ0NYB7_CERBT|nr:hypothetical protein RHO25_009244 [Cercospora beticola]